MMELIQLEQLRDIAASERWKAEHSDSEEASQGFIARAEVIEQLVSEFAEDPEGIPPSVPYCSAIQGYQAWRQVCDLCNELGMEAEEGEFVSGTGLVLRFIRGLTAKPEPKGREEPPQTIEDAVATLVSLMDDDDLKAIKAHPNSDAMIQYHHTLGRQVRNSFGLWQGNQALLDACGESHPDDASGKILEALWEHLQDADREPCEVNADGDGMEDIKAVYDRLGKGSVQGLVMGDWVPSVSFDWEYVRQNISLARITAKHADEFDPTCMDETTFQLAVIGRGEVVKITVPCGTRMLSYYYSGIEASRMVGTGRRGERCCQPLGSWARSEFFPKDPKGAMIAISKEQYTKEIAGT